MTNKQIKPIKICYMSKDRNLPEGFYVFREPNIWYPVIYLRKSKNADKKIYEQVKKYLIESFYD